MPTLSLKKIFIAIAGVTVLLNLENILRVFEPAYFWFCEALSGLRYFSDGAQTAIAFCSILLVVVLVMRVFEK